MIQTAMHPQIFKEQTPTFCGRELVVRKANSYLESLRIGRKIDLALTEEFYRTNQLNFPKFIRKMSIKVENFGNLITTPILDIRKADVHGIFDENGKILGGFVGKEFMKSYHICGLFLDKTIKRTKDSAKAMFTIIEQIKENAQKKNLKTISCTAYRTATPTIRLYKKAGFKEVPTLLQDFDNYSINLQAKANELGNNLQETFYNIAKRHTK